MKKSIIPVAAMVAITFGSMAAQADDSRPYRDGKPGMSCHKGQGHFQRMTERLNLSDEQQAKARTIFDNSKKRMRQLRDERRELHRAIAELDPANRDYTRQVRTIARKQGNLTEEMILERAETRKQFHMLLSEEQRAQAREMRQRFKERMERKGEKRDGWRERGRPDSSQERTRPM